MELFTAGTSNSARTSGLCGVGYTSRAAAVGKWSPKLPFKWTRGSVSGPGVEAEPSEAGKDHSVVRGKKNRANWP